MCSISVEILLRAVCGSPASICGKASINIMTQGCQYLARKWWSKVSWLDPRVLLPARRGLLLRPVHFRLVEMPFASFGNSSEWSNPLREIFQRRLLFRVSCGKVSLFNFVEEDSEFVIFNTIDPVFYFQKPIFLKGRSFKVVELTL
jgi:hypothetical protein